jgi:hypothetical protein
MPFSYFLPGQQELKIQAAHLRVYVLTGHKTKLQKNEILILGFNSEIRFKNSFKFGRDQRFF